MTLGAHKSLCGPYGTLRSSSKRDATSVRAADRLQHNSNEKPRIIKQRSSEARRARWLSQQEVLIADSDTAVLESTDVHGAFPKLPDYTNFSTAQRQLRAWHVESISAQEIESAVPIAYKDQIVRNDWPTSGEGASRE
ncbi:hypothetical protein CERZMDRAFT_107324 [Cercospora zeae-maydis SCOH1-5]|uniref:Uncharacterized protein n=1 Tax=Cercospora zeae-maydis SCOH1-5 TaxID=717836 RepID=A0A6A6F6B2_9PEZI|nr:hypothetical protein CERZMDRAFT_107324 [Cercospora zeae-maydis SCOH1-5]